MAPMHRLALLVLFASGFALAEEGTCHVYPKRCDDACKNAFASTITSTCAREMKAFNAAMLADRALSKQLSACLLACRKPGDDSSCVGPPDQAGCDCQTACYRNLPAALTEKAKAADACSSKAVAPVCK